MFEFNLIFFRIFLNVFLFLQYFLSWWAGFKFFSSMMKFLLWLCHIYIYWNFIFSKFFKLLLLMAHYLSCIFSSFCPDKGKEFFIFLFFIGCSYIFSWDFLSLYFSWSKKSEISHHSCLSKNVIDWDDFLVL